MISLVNQRRSRQPQVHLIEEDLHHHSMLLQHHHYIPTDLGFRPHLRRIIFLLSSNNVRGPLDILLRSSVVLRPQPRHHRRLVCLPDVSTSSDASASDRFVSRNIANASRILSNVEITANVPIVRMVNMVNQKSHLKILLLPPSLLSTRMIAWPSWQRWP